MLHAVDTVIWRFAHDQGCALVTKDEDFVTMRLRMPGIVPVVWLRIRNCPNEALSAWFMPKLPDVITLIAASEPLIELR